MPSTGAAARLADVLALERRGELLLAYDTACRALDEHPEDVRLRHRAVLLLARAGSRKQARRRFVELGLSAETDAEVLALDARLEKDAALDLTGLARAEAATRAAEKYLVLREGPDAAYPLVNAATLLVLAGHDEQAASLCEELLLVADGGDYWSAATRAEALLVLDRTTEAHDALREASSRAAGDWAAVATTRRQLEVLCRERGVDPSLLTALARPTVAHYCGHRMASAGLGAEEEEAAAHAIADVLERQPVHIAFGSLASGADLLWTEALLGRDVELHVVLPFERGSFLEASVAPAGPGWVARFDAALARAASVTYITEETQDQDDALFSAAADHAMGMTLLQGRPLAAEVVQLALWDGRPARGAAGTARDVERWGAAGHRTVVVEPPRGRARQVVVPAATPSGTAPRRRALRCLLFADVAGYTALDDDQLITFQQLVGPAWAGMVEGFGSDVLAVNTWGDALFVVLADVGIAARVALALKSSFADLPFSSHGLPPLGLRVAGHVGPVFEGWDPVAKRASWTGVHVNRAARLEPVTPPGEVYVTEAFAAALALAGEGELACEYVGHLPTAKGYRAMRMHRLHSVTR